MPSVVITGVGSYAPPKIVTNDDLSKTVATTDQWIFERTGIRARHIAGESEACSDLAVKAAEAALADAKVAPGEIDLLIVATITPDMPLPSTACIVQHRLGIPAHATCFDIVAACSGFLYALEIAYGQILTNRYQRALIIGS
jgi:3-oxoacyl-[acyl-carrier-protein] synthase-3